MIINTVIYACLLYTSIAGLDEAGRGPLAGPVTAAAVILPKGCLIPGLNDSKKLSEKKRLTLEKEIKAQAIAWSCASVNHRIIDNINILEASRLAMTRAIAKLSILPQHLLIDAVKLDIDIPQTSIIHGDALSTVSYTHLDVYKRQATSHDEYS